MRSLAEENYKRLGDISTDGGKFAILAAVVTANIGSVKTDTTTLVCVFAFGVFLILVGLVLYAVAKKKEKLRIEKELATSHSRKHKLRLLRDTKLVLEVEQPE